MTNAEIAAVFEEVADLLEFQGANPFRIRAYRNAARTIADLPESAATIVAAGGDLSTTRGIGRDLAGKVAELVSSGRLAMLEELLAEVPESVLALLRVPNLGPKRAAMLHRELGIDSLEGLRAACEAGQVRGLKGFGAKTEAKILDGLALAATAAERTLWARADEIARELIEYLSAAGGIAEIELAGSFRRGRETVGDLDILVVTDDVAAVMDRFGAYRSVAERLGRGETKMSVRLENHLQVDLRAVPAESFGAAMQYFTGSKDHNVVLRTLARERGLKINEYGVFRGEDRIAGRTEEEVYAALDLPWIPPELREARPEFAWAEAGTLPRLVEVRDLRGDLHMHSTWSDGMATIEEMARAAQERGLKYIAITDHSKRVAMAGGLSGDALRRQWEEVERVNKALKGIRVLKGVEVDILEQGGLDIEDEVLAQADWVVASVHYGQSQPLERITRRIVDALAHPSVSAIAHPTGRLIGERNPYQVDMDAVIAAARRHGKCLELNAHPRRLDLTDVACAAAKAAGVLVVIATDAHNIGGLDALRYGVLQARRGGLTAADVANTRSWPELKKRIGKR